MLKQGNGLRFVAHFGQAQCEVVKDRRVVRINGMKLLEKVAGTPKLALAGEGDGLFVGWGHVVILAQMMAAARRQCRARSGWVHRNRHYNAVHQEV